LNFYGQELNSLDNFIAKSQNKISSKFVQVFRRQNTLTDWLVNWHCIPIIRSFHAPRVRNRQ